MFPVSSATNVLNTIDANLNSLTNTNTWLFRSVQWLRAPNESAKIRADRAALAFWVALAVSLTIIGIIPVVLGIRIWKKLDQQQAVQEMDQKLNQALLIAPLQLNLPSANPVSFTEVPQAVGQANLDINGLDEFKFSKVADEVILGKQESLISVNPKYGKINLEELQKNQLLPTNQITLGEVDFYCSDVFKLNDNYAVIGLVEINNQVFPRVFYHSNSQGTWRVMPFAVKRAYNFWDFGMEFDGKKQLIRFGKGHCETDTQLPIAVTCALNRLPLADAKVNPFDAGQMVETHVQIDQKPAFLGQVNANHPFMFLEEDADNHFYNTGMDVPNPPNPKEIHLPADVNLHPDFSLKLADFKQTIPHYGEVTVNIFSSKDKNLAYLFYEAQDGRAFFASVEYIRGVGINSYGVREQYASVENMDAPLLEYAVQIPPGCEPQAPFENRYESFKYQSNWNYVRELEIIRLYYQEQGKEMPGLV